MLVVFIWYYVLVKEDCWCCMYQLLSDLRFTPRHTHTSTSLRTALLKQILQSKICLRYSLLSIMGDIISVLLSYYHPIWEKLSQFVNFCQCKDNDMVIKPFFLLSLCARQPPHTRLINFSQGLCEVIMSSCLKIGRGVLSPCFRCLILNCFANWDGFTQSIVHFSRHNLRKG